MVKEKGKEKPAWYKPKITESSGNVLWGLKVVRQNKLYRDLLDISSSKNTPFKQELFSNLLKNSGHSIFKNEENVKKVSGVLSKNDSAVFDQLKSVFIAGGEQNNVVKTLLRNWTLALPKKQNRTEWMLLNNYKNVSKSFVSELYKNDYLRNKIEEALKPLGQQSVPQAQVSQIQSQIKKQKSKPKVSGRQTSQSVIYNVKNYGNIGNVGKNYGGAFTFAGEAGQKPETQENQQKMMESLLEYNKNISDHLKALKQELGKPVERVKGGFEITGFKKSEKPEPKKEREAEQLGLGLKEKPIEGQLELPFNKLKNLIEKARDNPEFENLKNLYNFNSKPAREEFDKIIFEKQSGDEAQYNALKILLKNRDFNRMARAVKSENWGFSKLQALERIGSTINDSNKDEAIKIFSDLLKEKEVDEYYLTIHKTLDKVRDEKTRKYIFEKIKPSLLEAEGKMKPAAKQTSLGEDVLDFFKPPEEVKMEYSQPEVKEVEEYQAKVKKIEQWIKNQKKESET